MSAIFDFSFFKTWGIIRSSLFWLPDLENMGIAVRISLILCIEAEIYIISYLRPVIGQPSLISPLSTHLTVVSPDLENMGISAGISLLSCIETELR